MRHELGAVVGPARAEAGPGLESAQTPRALGYRLPAEWEPHRATWLTWPHHRTDWLGKKAAIPWVFAEFARLLSQSEKVCFLIEKHELARARSMLDKAGVDLTQLEFVLARTNRSWARDNLPLGVVTRPWAGCSAQPRAVAAVKFRFNGWARYRDHQLDEAAGRMVAERYPRYWLPRIHAGANAQRLVLEGGAIDVDGQGTLLATQQCLLGTRYGRNPGLSREQNEQLLSEFLGVEKILWLPAGIVGDDTSGHVDDFCRFIKPGCVVVAHEPNPRDPNHRPLAAAQERLQGLRDALGRTLEVVQLPMPSAVYFGDLRLPASYANFYVSNAALLVPTFNDPQDAVALGVLAELSDRPVIGVYARDLVLGLGTLHCSSQQEPAP